MCKKINIVALTIMKMVVAIVLVSGLSACASKEKEAPEVAAAPLVSQQSTLEEVRASYLYQLKQDGVQVIFIGETVRIVVNSDDLFIRDSANIKQSYVSVLATVSAFMNTYDMSNVKVAGYLDNQLSVDVAKKLSERQAQIVADKLRYYSVDTRFLYAVGYGRQYPVDSNESEAERSANRRIEISFYYYPNINR